jgi:hypothetical protein
MITNTCQWKESSTPNHHHPRTPTRHSAGIKGSRTRQPFPAADFECLPTLNPPWYTPISWYLSLPTTAGSVTCGWRLTVCVKVVPSLPPCPPGTGSSRTGPRPGQHYRIYWSSAYKRRSPPQSGLCCLCNRQNNFTLTFQSLPVTLRTTTFNLLAPEFHI